LVAAASVVAAAVLAVPGLVSAHTEFEPSAAAPGTIIALELFVEDERPQAGTSQVQLAFPPEPVIDIVDRPAVPGWTSQVDAGTPGTTGQVITWSGGPEPGDVRLPLVIGPLPDQPGQVQFKVIQTYDDGSEDAWIDDWPAGTSEPQNPGPVLQLEPGAAGELPITTAAPPATSALSTASTMTAPSASSTAPTSASTTTTPSTTGTAASTTTLGSTTVPPTDSTSETSENDDSNVGVIVGVIVAVVVIAAAVVAVVRRRNTSSKT